MLDLVQYHRYLHNYFDGEEKGFYVTNVLNNSTVYAEAKQIMEEKHCTTTRQNRVGQDLFGSYLTKVI